MSESILSHDTQVIRMHQNDSISLGVSQSRPIVENTRQIQKATGVRKTLSVRFFLFCQASCNEASYPVSPILPGVFGGSVWGSLTVFPVIQHADMRKRVSCQVCHVA